ncbi:DUF3862 domain-containing protein [Alteromonas pelagimontana]|uniref:DUF3862 domain-containing protein n=1 Tax=Alteromonas pelagimontana TaxID=1858656 RepID=A0A6M4M8M0_9ALTE|nr:DUF3862 domain-containing protein [Alteromonas pelagimontana]QJR79542.1 DUF3862 domain-containing protein [Alteromonas pelagimontana]
MKCKVLGCVLMALLVTACSKVSKENYEKLDAGMTQQQVEDVLGSADNCKKTLGTLSCVWGQESEKHIKVMFMADKAVTFSYEGL